MGAVEVTPVAWDLERINALQPSVDANPWGPLEDARDVFYGASLYEFASKPGESALVAVRPVSLAHGRRLDVVGLVSLADRLNMAALVASLEHLAHQHDAQQLAMCTKRAHLVRRALSLGWELTGQVMTKDLHVKQ